MKDRFFEYYDLDKNIKEDIFNKGIIIPDANVLLHLIRYKKEDADNLFKIFRKFIDRIHIPHQVALEYNKNKDNVIIDIDHAYDRLLKAINKAKESARKELTNSAINISNHPIIDLNSEIEKIDNIFNEACKEIEISKDRDHAIDAFYKQCDKISELLKNKIGNAYSKDKINDIIKNGKSRYESKIPPGYMDADKSVDGDKFGDFIIWNQIIDIAKHKGKSIIFITDDKKEDWWRVVNGKTIGPRPELRREIHEAANVYFHMYSFSQFLSLASDKIREPSVSKTVVDVTERSRDIRHARNRARDLFSIRENIVSLDMEINLLERDIRKNENILHDLRSDFIINGDGDETFQEMMSLRIRNIREKIGDLNIRKMSLVNKREELSLRQSDFSMYIMEDNGS